MQASHTGILTPDTAHVVRQCLDPPNSKSDSQPTAAAAGPYPSEAMKFNGQSKTKAMKTLAASAAACARKKRPINCTTKKAGVTPASGTSESPRADYTAAQYLEAEEQ